MYRFKKYDENDMISFYFEGKIRAGRIVMMSERRGKEIAYYNIQERRSGTYFENVPECAILCRADRLHLKKIWKLEERYMLAAFIVNDRSYYKLVNRTDDIKFVNDLGYGKIDEETCWKIWENGINISTMQLLALLSKFKGESNYITENIEYMKYVERAIKDDNQKKLVNIVYEAYEFLLEESNKAGILFQDYVDYCLLDLIDRACFNELE